jgi:hypothetical protein
MKEFLTEGNQGNQDSAEPEKTSPFAPLLSIQVRFAILRLHQTSARQVRQNSVSVRD